MSRIFVYVLITLIAWGSVAQASSGPPPPRYNPPSYIDPDYQPPEYSGIWYGQSIKTDKILQQYFPLPEDNGSWPHVLTIITEDIPPKSERERIRVSDAPASLRQEVDLASYPTCTANTYKSAKRFIDAIEGMPAINENFQDLLEIRLDMARFCYNGGGAAGIPEKLASLKEQEPLAAYAAYLGAALHFHGFAYEKAFQGFSRLAEVDARNPLDVWVKETAAYMKGRTLLIAAQEEWSGASRDIDAVVRDQARKALVFFQDYLKRYPDGMYKETATGIQNRIYLLLGEQENLDAAIKTSLNVQLNAVHDHESRERVYLLMRDVDRFFKGKIDIETDSPMLVAYLIMGMENEKKDARFDAGFTSILEKQKGRFERYPGLFDFLLGWSLYKQGRYQDLVDKIPALPPEKGNPVNNSGEFLRAKAFRALKNYKVALDILERMQESAPEEAIELEIVSLQLERNYKAMIFSRNSVVKSERLLRDVAQYALGDADILRAIGRRLTSGRNKRLLTEELMKRYLVSGRFVEMNALYQQSKDTGIFESLRSVIPLAAPEPDNREILVEIGRFLYTHRLTAESSLTGYDRWSRTGREEFFAKCKTCSAFDERKKEYQPAFFFFKKAYDQYKSAEAGADMTEAVALHYMIRCFKGTDYQSFCRGGRKFDNQSRKWFGLLHSKYKGSAWAKKTPYYYNDVKY